MGNEMRRLKTLSFSSVVSFGHSRTSRKHTHHTERGNSPDMTPPCQRMKDARRMRKLAWLDHKKLLRLPGGA